MFNSKKTQILGTYKLVKITKPDEALEDQNI